MKKQKQIEGQGKIPGLTCNVKTCELYSEHATGLCVGCAKGVVVAMERLGVPTDKVKENLRKYVEKMATQSKVLSETDYGKMTDPHDMAKLFKGPGPCQHAPKYTPFDKTATVHMSRVSMATACPRCHGTTIHLVCRGCHKVYCERCKRVHERESAEYAKNVVLDRFGLLEQKFK